MTLNEQNENDIIQRQNRAVKKQLEQGPAMYDNGAMMYFAKPAIGKKKKKCISIDKQNCSERIF